MPATRLLVLGIVRAQGCTHGYVIGREMHAIGAGKWANTKNGSIYHALRQLTKEGMLASAAVNSDDGPSRTDYTITASGEEEFQFLMREALSEPVPRADMLCAGLAMMTALPRAKVLSYLRFRLDVLSRHKADIAKADAETEWSGNAAVPQHLETLIGFWANHTNSNYNWIAALVKRIENGAYAFADNDPRTSKSPIASTLKVP